MSEKLPILETTPEGLRALNHLRGRSGSFQEALFQDAEASHLFRAKLAEAEASNARLREALEMIHRWFRPEPGWDPCKCGRCPECVSRAALEVKP